MEKKRILVVEDDARLADLVREYLAGQGFDVQVAADGEAGLQQLSNEPDLILLDIMLPKMDGLTLMGKIREHGPWGAKVPILIISNLNPETDDILKATATHSPAFYLVKAEFSLEEIAERVKTALHF